MLEAIGKFNQLSPELRKDLESKLAKAGKRAKYRFAIAKKNPDGEQKTGGEYLYPLLWTLTPVTYDIIDPYDKQRKRIGLVKNVKENGIGEDEFKRLHIKEGWQGKYELDLSKPDDQDLFAFLELHPKLEGGKFRDQHIPAMITKIDAKADASKNIEFRNTRINALFVAQSFSDQEVRDFASAMGWNEEEEPEVLRDRVLEIADKDAEFFREFIDNKHIEYRAVIQRAIDSKIIAFVPVENKFVWSSNNQPIAVLERAEGDQVLDRMCDWIMTSKNGIDVFNKLKSMLATKNKVQSNIG